MHDRFRFVCNINKRVFPVVGIGNGCRNTDWLIQELKKNMIPHLDSKGQALGVTILVGLGIAIFVVVTLFNALNLNTGLYATSTNTMLPLLVLGTIAAILIALFR